jgi:hypothetical protein
MANPTEAVSAAMFPPCCLRGRRKTVTMSPTDATTRAPRVAESRSPRTGRARTTAASGVVDRGRMRFAAVVVLRVSTNIRDAAATRSAHNIRTRRVRPRQQRGLPTHHRHHLHHDQHADGSPDQVLKYVGVLRRRALTAPAPHHACSERHQRRGDRDVRRVRHGVVAVAVIR